MFGYSDDLISVSESVTDFEELGVVDMQRLDSTPFYTFMASGKSVMRSDTKKCGGYCLNYLNRYVDIFWMQLSVESADSTPKYKKISPRICDVEDIGKELFDTGILAICPPKKGLTMENQELRFP